MIAGRLRVPKRRRSSTGRSAAPAVARPRKLRRPKGTATRQGLPSEATMWRSARLGLSDPHRLTCSVWAALSFMALQPDGAVPRTASDSTAEDRPAVPQTLLQRRLRHRVPRERCGARDEARVRPTGFVPAVPRPRACQRPARAKVVPHRQHVDRRANSRTGPVSTPGRDTSQLAFGHLPQAPLPRGASSRAPMPVGPGRLAPETLFSLTKGCRSALAFLRPRFARHRRARLRPAARDGR